MPQIAVSVLLLGLAGELAGAQQPDTTTVARARPVAPQVAGAARRDIDNRRRRLDFLDANTVSAKAAWLRERRALGTTLLTSGDEQTTYLLVSRTVSSKPEVHARWDDLVIVRSGTGAIEMGDSLVGSEYRAPGERAGGTFSKSYQIVVRAGDLVRIPAAVPHAFIVSGTEPLEYLVVKQRRQELPIRWFREQ